MPIGTDLQASLAANNQGIANDQALLESLQSHEVGLALGSPELNSILEQEAKTKGYIAEYQADNAEINRRLSLPAIPPATIPNNGTIANPAIVQPATNLPTVSEAAIAPTPPAPTVSTTQYIGPNTSETTTLGLAASAYPNLLHDYSSYTYNLTLSALTPDTYNQVITNEGKYIPNNVMIASAGRWDGTTQKDPRFDVDFFFDRLEFDTIIGMTTQSRNSNALAVEFTIIEPYGMTLINRLIDMSNTINSANKGNYIQLPYMLQIDFYGHNDSGIPTLIPNISKFLPIRITGIKFKIGVKGTEYNVSAAPYSHQAFSETLGTTPIKLEVAASNVQQFFLSKPSVPVVEYDTNAQYQTRTVLEAPSGADIAKAQQINRVLTTTTGIKGTTVGPNGTRIDTKTSMEQQAKSLTQSHLVTQTPDELKNVKSYAGAVNAWYQSLVNSKKLEVADEILFAIDDEIANAVFPTKDVISKAARGMNKAADASQDFLTPGLDEHNNPVAQITINQGTSIIDVVSLAVRNSSYITDQFLDPTKGEITVSKMKEFLDKPLKWFNISPAIEIIGYDELNNRTALRITYNVTTKVVYQTKNPEAPLGGPKTIVKDYQYIFTGKNQDVINFELNFDTQFYVVNPANAANADITAQNNDQTPPASQKITDGNRILSKQEIQELLTKRADGINELKPRKIQVASVPAIGNPPGSKAELAQQLEKNIMTTPGGDMIQVILRIVGDPDFIKQDGCFYGLRNLEKDARKTPNGSLVTDAADLYVNLTFKTPIDYDNNGMASPTSNTDRYSSSLFSGIYRVIQVKNHFTNGRFEQELTLIRYSLQVAPGLAAPVTDNNQSQQRENTNDEPTNPTPNNTITSTPTTPTNEPATPTGAVANPVGVTGQGVDSIITEPLSTGQIIAIKAGLSLGITPSQDLLAQYNRQVTGS